MDRYLEDTGGALMELAARALGAEARVAGLARGAGWAMAVAQFLRAAPDLSARGRVPLVDDGPDALRDLAARALARLDAVRGVPRGVAPAFWPGWQTRGLLRRVATDPAAVTEGRMALPEFTRRAGLLWRALSGRP